MALAPSQSALLDAVEYHAADPPERLRLLDQLLSEDPAPELKTYALQRLIASLPQITLRELQDMHTSANVS